MVPAGTPVGLSQGLCLALLAPLPSVFLPGASTSLPQAVWGPGFGDISGVTSVLAGGSQGSGGERRQAGALRKAVQEKGNFSLPALSP